MLVCSILVLAFLQLISNQPDMQRLGSSSPLESPIAQTISLAGIDRNLEGAFYDTSRRDQARQTVDGEQTLVNRVPVPALTGTPGLFSVETAEDLPKGVVTISSYANKFGRAPGSVSILSGGLTVADGLTTKITIFGQFEPYRHLHIGEPSQLSLRQPAGCPHDVFEAPIYCGLNPGPLNNTWKGPAAGYVADFPFAAFNQSDWGPVTLGLKANFWSETRGDPLSVSMRFSFIVPTEGGGTEFSKFGAQMGALNYSFTLALSRTLGQGIVLAHDITYLVTRNPQANGQTLLTPGDQIIFGQGFIFRPQRRLQFLTEFTGTLGQEGHGFGLIGIDTENTSRGPSNPVDGVWGLRWYFLKSIALDVGYRYMINLHQVNDRSGFTIKISKTFGALQH
ncbi:MAG: hypothetical protein JOZ36_13490 [Acidobacteria bacterium]|nr:hypothetical protein [Acidobacteriota bacterium]